MSVFEATSPEPSFTAEDVLVRVRTALLLLDLATQTLETAPIGENELPLDAWELYRYLMTGKIGGSDRS